MSQTIEMIDPVTGEIIDQQQIAEQLLAQAKAQGMSLVGPGGLLSGLTKQVLETALEASFPGVPAVPYVMMAATDSRHFHRFSPAVYRFAPLEMSNAQRASIHGVDEFVETATLERGERFHRALLENLS